jgi:hypothetical protein
MRKPDGQGRLNVPASAGKSRTPSRQRSQSTDTPTPTPHTAIPPPDFGSGQTHSDATTGPTGLMRLQEKLAKKEVGQATELMQAAVRRKSVLPKSGRGDDVASSLEPPVPRTAVRTSYVAETSMKEVGQSRNYHAPFLTISLQTPDYTKDRPTTATDTANTETTSSRRRLAQLSINALPDHEARQSLLTGTSTTIKSTSYIADKARALEQDDVSDIATQKARLGRRRSSLFKPTDV